jgi:hypothetical protein
MYKFEEVKEKFKDKRQEKYGCKESLDKEVESDNLEEAWNRSEISAQMSKL